MKNLRQYIRQILLEDKAAFVEELTDDPNWDEGATDYADVAFRGNQRIPRGARPARARKRGRNLKQVWAKHVDREFVDSLIYIHWMAKEEVLPFLLESEPPNRDELSCSAYINGKLEAGHNMGALGVIVTGHVTLLGNSMDAMYTGNRSTIDQAFPEMKGTSGVQKGVMAAEMDTYILSKEDFTGPKSKYDENEALLDNWEVIALFCDKKFLGTMKKIRDDYEYETGNYLAIKHPGAYI